MNENTCIVTVSIWDRCKLYFSSSIFGIWIVCKMFVKWVWDGRSYQTVQQRDSPPPCLVDSILGQHKYVKLKGVKLHYVESGSKNQPLVLLLHGFPDCWLSWRHQIPKLSEYFRVIALDLKGFGDSDKPFKKNTYRIDVILDELKQLISTLGVSKCIIIGHDIGGIIGWYLTIQYPEIVVKLIVISSPHPTIYRKTLNTMANYQWLNFVRLPYFPEIDALKDDLNIINYYHKHLGQKDEYLEAYKYSFSRTEDWTGPLNYFRNLPYYDIDEKLEPIQIPVMLITGNRDKLLKLESIVRSTEYCDKFHVKIIDGTGHFPHQEQPIKFNEVLLKYLVKKKTNRLQQQDQQQLDRTNSKGLMNMMFGAVTNTVKYGNSVLDTVQKRTNGVVGNIPHIALLNYNPIYDKTE